MKNKQSSSPNSDDTISVDCEICGDTGSILKKVKVPDKDNPYYPKDYYIDTWKRCSCVEQRALQARFKNALIPEEFEDARLNNYRRETEVQHILYNAIEDYLRDIQTILDEKPKQNSIGFIATFGEERIRNMQNESDRFRAMQEHNSFGLGKTHLQIAAARWIMQNVKITDEFEENKKLNKKEKKKVLDERSAIQRGCSVLCISDVDFMEELMNHKRAGGDGLEEFERMKRSVIDVDVLVWDDLAKSNYSRAKEDAYYSIINERYRHNRPILFSSNEDEGTIAVKIGRAASSRLLSMCKGRLYSVEGEDQRF